jgi:methylmalonyl-CoA mutase
MPAASLLLGYLAKARIEPQAIACNFKADPIGELAAQGELPISLAAAFDEMALLADWTVKKNLNYKTITIDASIYHNSGASAVEELAFAIATGLEYIREMSKRQLPVDAIARQMTFIFSIGPRFFTEIAKLRAARTLWSNAVSACGGDEQAQKMIIHSKTSYYNKTGLEPHVNMLRTTTEAFSAVAGGCDSLHVGYYDEAVRQPDEFSRRFARNVQLILREECHLNKIIDPAGGSWYVESLTDQLTRQAWKLFRKIESEGGIIESLKNGSPQQITETVAAKRQENIATRKDIFVGTTMYASITERPIEKQAPDYKRIHADRINDLQIFSKSINNDQKSQSLESLFQSGESASIDLIDKAVEAAANGATIGEIARAIRKTGEPGIKIYPLKIHRGGELFEVLRTTVDRFREKSKIQPKAFLACFGKLSGFKQKEDFARRFFQAGGFEINSHQLEEVNAAVDTVIKSQAPLTVICSSDDKSDQIAGSFTRALKQKKSKMIIIMTGNPGDKIEEFKKTGIDEFIYLGVNVYEILVRLSRKIGVLS